MSNSASSRGSRWPNVRSQSRSAAVAAGGLKLAAFVQRVILPFHTM
ncbi:hypothetical protein [Amycolatopsis taiwanensis]|nr:hypothetical protein [Amycolatopsis taiwanensis]